MTKGVFSKLGTLKLTKDKGLPLAAAASRAGNFLGSGTTVGANFLLQAALQNPLFKRAFAKLGWLGIGIGAI